jgi:hypothetical protein
MIHNTTTTTLIIPITYSTKLAANNILNLDIGTNNFNGYGVIIETNSS